MSKFSIFKGKTVLVTGHTGFKGSWLTLWLHKLGANVIGLADNIPTNPSNFEVSELSSIHSDNRINILDTQKVESLIKENQPDFIFHLAAQALVKSSYDDPLNTMSINSMGSANILNALRDSNFQTTVIMVTSDKAYDNVEWEWGYRENDKLGGKDPYSASKGMAELVIRSYIESFFRHKDCKVRIAITRAGNVIGGGDWAKDRIVPDCVRAWSNGESVQIRSPNATRPWQHVLEPLSGYLHLAANLSKDIKFHGEAYNFGPLSQNNHSVADLINEMSEYWENVKWEDVSDTENKFYEAGLLKLNCDKALMHHRWLPTLNFEQTVRMTTEWYKKFYASESMQNFSLSQIDEYCNFAIDNKIDWA